MTTDDVIIYEKLIILCLKFQINPLIDITLGLIECAKLRPEDPVDYIAEYLYQHNPELE